MPIGRAQASDDFPTESQLAWLLGYVRKNNSRNLRIYVGENLTFLGSWEREIRNTPAICPIGFTACCIGVDGMVRGCPEQADNIENQEGSLLETSFQEIWQKGFGRYRSRDILGQDKKCSRCDSKADCLGGCWVMRGRGRQCIYELLPSPGCS